jgi:hypothetical protein
MAVSNTLTNTTATLLAQEGLEAFKTAIAPIASFSFTPDPNPRSKGYTINVPVITARTAGAWSNSYAGGNSAIVSAQVSLDTHSFSGAAVIDSQASVSPFNYLQLMSRECGAAVARAVLNTVLGKILLATFGNTEGASKVTVAAASFDSDYVADLVDAANDRNIPETNRSLILTNAYYSALIKDPAVKDASAFGGSEGIRGGKVPMLMGMPVYRINAFPTAVAAENTVGILVHPSALAVSMAGIVPADPEMAGRVAQIEQLVDDESGITLTFRRHYDTTLGESTINWECLHGAVAVQTAGLVRIVSA